METVKVDNYHQIPKGFTGIAEYPDGTKFWYLDGKRHRTDGPAVEGSDGTKEWYLDGKCHRTDGPAVEGSDGGKYWFLNGLYHRTDGPAIEYPNYPNGRKYWYLNDKQVYISNPIGEYVVIEEGLPSNVEWLGKKVPTLKVLTSEGFKYIPKLPGI